MLSSERPVIGFLTDFGFDGAAATCRGVMLTICRDAQIVDISHSVRKFAVRDGAFVFARALPYLPVGHHVGVVDPGVGTSRRPVAILTARGDVLVGPDNGLLVPAAEALGGLTEARALTNTDLWLSGVSSTFHGRDVFAPVAARLAAGEAAFGAVGDAVALETLIRPPEPKPEVTEDRLATEVVYVDSFGNLRLAGGDADLEAAFGTLRPGDGFRVSVDGSASEPATFAPTFGHVAPGALLLYIDSGGDLALADNQGDLARRVGAVAGAPVIIERA